MKPIAILGAGNLGTALAVILARHKRPVRMYCIEDDVTDEINTRHKNSKYLSGHVLPKNVTASDDIEAVLDGASVVFVAVPSFVAAEVAANASPFLKKGTVVACMTKGIDQETFEPIVESVMRELLPGLRRSVVVIGGPAIAVEMAKGAPTGLQLGSADKNAARVIKALLDTPMINIEISSDVRGIGLCSALKNVYAIPLGMCDGLKYPANAKALVLTHALIEMGEIVVAAGGKRETVYGLAGLGDLVTTSFSAHSRNRTYGERLVTASSKDPHALGLTTVEGIRATELGRQLVRKLKIKTPLLDATVACVNAKKNFSKPFQSWIVKA